MTLKTRAMHPLSFNMDITYIVAVILHNVHPAYPVHKLSMHPHAFPLQARPNAAGVCSLAGKVPLMQPSLGVAEQTSGRANVDFVSRRSRTLSD